MGFIQVKKCLSEPKQFLKLIVVVICTCITIYQLSECLKKILNPPITSTFKFNLNESIKYPAVTVCRKPPYKYQLFPNFGMKNSDALSFEKQFLTFDYNTSTVAKFLETTTFSTPEMIPLYSYEGHGFSQESMEIRENYFLDKGRCNTLIPKENSKVFSVGGGYFLYFKHDITNSNKDLYMQSSSGFEIYLHEQDAVIVGDDEEMSNILDTIYLENNEDMIVNLKLQTFTLVSSKEDPCVSEVGYSRSRCEEECYHRKVAELVGCTLPWLRNVPEGTPQCDKYDTVQSIIRSFNDFNRTKFTQECTCRQSCTSSLYNMQIISRTEADVWVKPGSTMNIYYPTNLISEMEQTCGYDWNMFLADIGGSMGFLLGLSVIGIITVIESFILLLTSNKKSEGKDGTAVGLEEKDDLFRKI